MGSEGSAGHHSPSSPAASFYRCEQRGPELEGNLSRQARGRPLIRIDTPRSATWDKKKRGERTTGLGRRRKKSPRRQAGNSEKLEEEKRNLEIT